MPRLPELEETIKLSLPPTPAPTSLPISCLGEKHIPGYQSYSTEVAQGKAGPWAGQTSTQQALDPAPLLWCPTFSSAHHYSPHAITGSLDSSDAWKPCSSLTLILPHKEDAARGPPLLTSPLSQSTGSSIRNSGSVLLCLAALSPPCLPLQKPSSGQGTPESCPGHKQTQQGMDATCC